MASCRPPMSWYVLCLQEVGNWGFEEHCYVHGLGIAAQCETIEAPLVGRIVVLLTSLCFTRPHKSHSSVSFCQKAMEKVQMSHYFYTHWTKINSNLFKFLLPGSTIWNQQIMELFLKLIIMHYFSIFIAYYVLHSIGANLVQYHMRWDNCISKIISYLVSVFLTL